MPLFAQLLQDTRRATLLTASLWCHPTQRAWLAKQRKAAVEASIIERTGNPEVRAMVCHAVLDTMVKADIVAFIRRHCITAAVSRYNRVQLAEFILSDATSGPKAVPVACKARLRSSPLDGNSGRGPTLPSTDVVEVGPSKPIRARMHKKWMRLARKAYKLEVRKKASKLIREIIHDQMVKDPTQSIGDLWCVVAKKLGHKAQSSTRIFFHDQIMKFYKKNRYVATKQTWLRRRVRRDRHVHRARDKQLALQHMELHWMRTEDVLSGPLADCA